MYSDAPHSLQKITVLHSDDGGMNALVFSHTTTSCPPLNIAWLNSKEEGQRWLDQTWQTYAIDAHNISLITQRQRWQSLIWAQLNIYYCNKNADRTGILLFTRFLHQSTFFHYWLKKKKHVYIEGWKRNWSFMYSLIVDQSEIFFYSIIQRCRQELTTMTLTEPSNASSSPSSSSGSHDSRGSIHLGINEQVILSGY